MEFIIRLPSRLARREANRAPNLPWTKSRWTFRSTTRDFPCPLPSRTKKHRQRPNEFCFLQSRGLSNFIAIRGKMNMRKWKAFCSAAVISGVLWTLPASMAAQDAVFDSDTISGLGSRNIGSAAMSGRIAAVTAVKEDGRLTVYVGAASGGVWKSVNGGTTFKPVFDKQPVQSIGAIAIDPKNPKTVWVGTGESWTRNSVSYGDGVYKSTDGGDNWTNLGLPNSERIAKIAIDPSDTNTVYVCVPGKLWSDSDDRGVYKTADGGKSWTKVLKGPNVSTGCSMLSMDRANPKTLYAGMWDFRRKGWTFRSGGEGPGAPSGSGLFKSIDGGTTWQSLTSTSAAGLPAKPWGRVAVALAPS